MFSILRIKKLNTKIRNATFIVILILILTTSLVSAAGEGATVTVTRLSNTKIGIKIVFPNEISGNFGGVIYPNYFDCDTYPPNTLYCVAPLAYWVDAATLHIYGIPGGEVMLTKIISVPPRLGESPEPPPEEIPECQECGSNLPPGGDF